MDHAGPDPDCQLIEQHRVQALKQWLLDLRHDAQIVEQSQNESHVNQAERVRQSHLA